MDWVKTTNSPLLRGNNCHNFEKRGKVTILSRTILRQAEKLSFLKYFSDSDFYGSCRTIPFTRVQRRSSVPRTRIDEKPTRRDRKSQREPRQTATSVYSAFSGVFGEEESAAGPFPFPFPFPGPLLTMRGSSFPFREGLASIMAVRIATRIL